MLPAAGSRASEMEGGVRFAANGSESFDLHGASCSYLVCYQACCLQEVHPTRGRAVQQWAVVHHDHVANRGADEA